jgi:hypothetical protein
MYRINIYGIEEWGCVYKPFEYSRLWGTPTLPEHEPVPWRDEDIPGIFERNPHWKLEDWMTAAPTTTPTLYVTTPPPSTTPQPAPAVVATTPAVVATTPAVVTTTPAVVAVTPTSAMAPATIGLIIGGVVALVACILIITFCVHSHYKVKVPRTDYTIMAPKGNEFFQGVKMGLYRCEDGIV